MAFRSVRELFTKDIFIRDKINDVVAGALFPDREPGVRDGRNLVPLVMFSPLDLLPNCVRFIRF